MSGELREQMHSIAKAVEETGGRITSSVLPIRVNGRKLDYTPTNIGMDEVASQLALGQSVFVRLEPGDATRYDLMVTPLNAVRMPGLSGAYGLEPVDGYWLVSLVNIGNRPCMFMAKSDLFQVNLYNDELLKENGFTRLAVCWFVGTLSAFMDRMKESAPVG